MQMHGGQNGMPCYSRFVNSGQRDFTVFAWFRDRLIRRGVSLPGQREAPGRNGFFSEAQGLSITANAAGENAAVNIEHAARGSAEDYCEQAETLRIQGRLHDARAVIELALRTFPLDPGLNYRLGLLWLATGDAEQALDLFNLTLHYQFDFFPACSGKLKAMETLGRGSESIAVVSDFLNHCPGHLEACIALADLYYRLGDHQAVLRILEPLVQAEAVDRSVANLLGLVLGRELGEFERADALLRRALEVTPDWLPALTNLGWNLLEQGRHQEGYAFIDRALAIAPEDVEARLVRACMKLKQGEFSAGWREYGVRHSSRFAIARPYRFPQWRGEPLEGKTLLIYGEQGVGDQIMFASCFQEVIALSGRTIIECNPKLVSLFKRSFPHALVQENVPSGAEPVWLETAGKIDYQIAMGDLPALFRNHWNDFPRHDGYLVADPERVRYWKSRLAELGTGFKLGLSWRGGSIATRRHLRSVPLDQLVPVLQMPLKAISLQYDSIEPDLKLLRSIPGIELTHWTEAIDDYDQTAALICALDGVLSVCTAAVHLAGALGRKVWVIAPVVTEWRYLEKGDSLPWYPSAQIIRQEKIRSWDGAIGLAIKAIGPEIGKNADNMQLSEQPG